MPDSAPAPRRPIGAAIRRNDEARERAARITEADIFAARLLWMRYSPPGWQGMIEARREGEQAR
jgi:hypothetical protein